MRLELDPDRLFPADPRTRDIARGLYASVKDLPIISPHGHVAPALLTDNHAFPDPSDLFIRHDHYVTRMLHAAGFDLTRVGISDGGPVATPSEVWRLFCRNWHLYAGTASGYWMQTTLVELFGIDASPSADNADRLFVQVQERLARPEFRPRALFERFGIEVLATTDDPLDDLALHRTLASDPAFPGRVLPTFRPDAYIDPRNADFPENVERLAEWGGHRPSDFGAYLAALAARRRFFVENGAVSADHGVLQPLTVELDRADAQDLFVRVLAGEASTAEQATFAGAMLLEMARMSTEDGLVMTIHPGVVRNHHQPTFERFGPDTGHDIPTTTRFVEPLRPLLHRFGDDPDFHLVLFSVDETAYSREIAPLAGFYPSVYIGAPWWFLDAPDAVLRFRAAVTETAGFYRSSGFVDDTRAFLSIPARHDMARRLDSAFLARLVREGRIPLPMAERIATDQVVTLPRKVFKL